LQRIAEWEEFQIERGGAGQETVRDVSQLIRTTLGEALAFNVFALAGVGRYEDLAVEWNSISVDFSPLLSDVEQERPWHSIAPFRWPAGETKQAQWHRESAAVGIAAAAVHTEQVLIGPRPVTGALAFVQIELRR
jgi:hypothetical protein